MARTLARIAITGASGFIGHAAARRLLAEGREVHALLRPDARMWRFRDMPAGLVVHPADLLDPASVLAALAAARPDAVIHCAAYGSSEREADADRIFQTLISGTQILLSAARAAGAELFVNAGSSSEYGFRDTPMCETDLPHPNSIYAVAKLAQTNLCRLAAAEGGLEVVTLRIFSAYGPWESPGRLVPTLLRRARAGLPLEMADPSSAHDFVYITDVLDALCGLERLRGRCGDTFNLGTGVETDLRGVVAAVREVTASTSDVVWHALPPRRWDARHWKADTIRSRDELGWQAQVVLRDGLRRTAEWLAGFGDRYGPD